MNKYVLLVIVLVSFTACSIARNETSDLNDVDKNNVVMPENSKNEEASYYYTCPMHPEVRSDKPGVCPKCNMNLEKKDINTR